MRRLLTLTFCLWAGLAAAVEPDEVLDDPVLEKRARSISSILRCLQCRNESIDESNAGIARDLRLLVRERLLAGDSDTEVIDHVVARYGEFVLLRPNGAGANLVLWLAGPAMFALGAGIIVLSRRRRKTETTKPLSAKEEAALTQLLQEREKDPT